MSDPSRRGRWVAIVTGAISIAIAVAYLALITVLDARGPLLPPPPEALGLVEPLTAGAVSVNGSLNPPAEAGADPAAAAGVPPRG
ncbi:MAG: hypothetical protein ACKO5M_05915 [Vulcanococcus sp.]